MQLNKELKSLMQNFGHDMLSYFGQYHGCVAEAIKEAVKNTEQAFSHRIVEMS